jgi:DEAD/DEAH box helicase domain-containing protein
MSGPDARLTAVTTTSAARSALPPIGPMPIGPRPAARLRPARSADEILARLIRPPGRAQRVTHVEEIAARTARSVPWPEWVRPDIVDAFAELGIDRPWEHQVEAATLAHDGRSVVVATATASGKSLAYQLPVLQALLDGAGGCDRATALYLSPTKALAADQLRALGDIALPGVRAATYDGDTDYEERAWIRAQANLVLANPDLVHRSLLPAHRQWQSFLRGLRYVVIDECHGYRGIFGSHVAQVIRRLRRVAAAYGADPVFILASATVSEPATSASRLVGLDVEAVTDDASPRAASRFVLWEPPLLMPHLSPGAAPSAALSRRSVMAETADVLSDLVLDGIRTVAFVRSRRGVEAVALAARRTLGEVDAALPARVAAYRGGYLPAERRALERALRSGSLLGLAATTALELGIDVSGLDAVVLAGFPGTRASMWQQAGRAGRAGQESLAIMISRDDPLDTYLVHHPEALFGAPVEAAVFDPSNPYVLAPHLCAAAGEWPLTPDDLAMFGPTAAGVVDALVADGYLRARPNGWFWARRERACDLADIRGSGGQPVQIVEASTGQLLGTADTGAAHASVHTGAVYLHQGETYLVHEFRHQTDESDQRAECGVALVERADVDYFTSARDVTDVRIVAAHNSVELPGGTLSFGTVEVTSQVLSYLRRRVGSGEVLAEQPLELPPRELSTRAVWWTVPDEQLVAAGLARASLPGAAHAAEHASIGLLPLVATCDRWDIGGVSTAVHADTGMLTVVVYDGQPGGAGIAERGFAAAQTWLSATREAIASCRCETGCPSCVQSPKCGNGNEPLDKPGAVTLLDTLLRGPRPGYIDLSIPAQDSPARAVAETAVPG